MHDAPVRVGTDMEESPMPSPVRGEGIQGGPGPSVEQDVVILNQPAGPAGRMKDAGGVSSPRSRASPTVANAAIGTVRAVGAIGGAAASPKKKFAWPTVRRRQRQRQRQRTHALDAVIQSTSLGVRLHEERFQLIVISSVLH
eukprot:366052-Chlamydomonas_euryale.AAC.18